MESIKYYFGIRVSEFRRLNGLTQKELAEKMGMTASFVTKMGRGLKTPTLPNAVEFARCLGVHLDWLSFDKHPSFNKPPDGLIQLAQMPRGYRMAVMNRLAEAVEAAWDVLGEPISKIYGSFMGLPWKSRYWKVFALLFTLEQLGEHSRAENLLQVDKAHCENQTVK